MEAKFQLTTLSQAGALAGAPVEEGCIIASLKPCIFPSRNDHCFSLVLVVLGLLSSGVISCRASNLLWGLDLGRTLFAVLVPTLWGTWTGARRGVYCLAV